MPRQDVLPVAAAQETDRTITDYDAAVKGYEVGILIGEIVVQVQGENPVAEKPQPILNAPVVVVSDVIAKPDVRRIEIFQNVGDVVFRDDVFKREFHVCVFRKFYKVFDTIRADCRHKRRKIAVRQVADNRFHAVFRGCRNFVLKAGNAFVPFLAVDPHFVQVVAA